MEAELMAGYFLLLALGAASQVLQQEPQGCCNNRGKVKPDLVQYGHRRQQLAMTFTGWRDINMREEKEKESDFREAGICVGKT